MAKARPVRFNEHIEGDGPIVFAHACKMGLEGVVSKRKDSMYRSGRSPDWLKMKNLAAPTVKREAEEDWGKSRGRLAYRIAMLWRLRSFPDLATQSGLCGAFIPFMGSSGHFFLSTEMRYFCRAPSAHGSLRHKGATL